LKSNISARAAIRFSLGSRRPEQETGVKLFDDPLHDEFASWPLGLLGPAGGAVGEVAAIAASLTSPDDDAFVAAWTAAADRHVEEAEQAGKAGHALHARGHYLRAAALATFAENDPLAVGVQDFLGRLSRPTTLLRFSALEGAGGHCELQNRWLANQRILDWLDDLFAG
jgi:hypothetical protein